MNNRFSELVQEFLTSYIIGECNYSRNTKSSYSTTFYLFLEFMSEEKNIKPNKIEIESTENKYTKVSIIISKNRYYEVLK